MPSRRQSLLILGLLGLTAAAGGAYLLESHGTSDRPGDSPEGAPPDRPLAPITPPGPVPSGEYLNWRPNAPRFTPVDDRGQQIKGYASATSVGLGESIDFHVSVRPAQKFTVKVFRLGRIPAGAESNLVATSPELSGVSQSAPRVVEPTRTVVAPWAASWRLDVPADWKSGLYVAVFESTAKFRSLTPFVVRDDHKAADLLVVLPFTTYQAYNMYPVDRVLGSSLYSAYLPSGKMGGADICSTRVSFDRPYQEDGLPRLFELDQAFVEWVETQPYSVSYASGLDLHAGRVKVTDYKALVFSGHDEYWSAEMRAELDKALGAGIGVAFMAANNVYWSIRMDASAAGVEHRQVTCYKRHQDPAAVGGVLPTVLWRDLGQPEQRVLGAMYTAIITDPEPRPLVVAGAGHWFWKGTGLRDGDQLAKLVGGEADRVHPNVKDKPDVAVLAASPFTAEGPGGRPHTQTQHTVLHQHPSGAWVFNAGTFYWNHGLSTPGFVDSRVQIATQNLLDRMTGKSGA